MDTDLSRDAERYAWLRRMVADGEILVDWVSEEALDQYIDSKMVRHDSACSNVNPLVAGGCLKFKECHICA